MRLVYALREQITALNCGEVPLRILSLQCSRIMPERALSSRFSRVQTRDTSDTWATLTEAIRRCFPYLLAAGLGCSCEHGMRVWGPPMRKWQHRGSAAMESLLYSMLKAEIRWSSYQIHLVV